MNLKIRYGATVSHEAYEHVVTRNIAALRVRLDLHQKDLAERMKDLGYRWRQQTVADIENDKRRVTVGELLGLAHALETDVPSLLLPPRNYLVTLPSGLEIDSGKVEMLILGYRRGPVRWEGRAGVPHSTDEQAGR